MVDGFVLTVGDLVIVEVDLVEDGLVEVTPGVWSATRFLDSDEKQV